jgi:glucose/arabinose dehydrogenase
MWPLVLPGVILGTGLAGVVVQAQLNAVHVQPRADTLPAPSQATANSPKAVPQPDKTLPTVPTGFSVSSVAALRGPRVMVFAPNGDLFVSSPSANSIFVLRDTNHDGTFQSLGVFADGTTAPAPAPPASASAGRPASRLGVLEPPQALVPNPPACTPPPAYRASGPGGVRLPFGLAFLGDYLYVGNTDSVVRFEYRSGDLKARGAPEKLLDLPTGGHSTRNIVFNRAGTKMYIAVGSASNSDAGEDCRRAAILEANPDGGAARVFASGIRNPVGLTLQPGSDILWAATNERDNLGDNLVPDYATSVKEGGFYGWPYSYIGRHYDPKYVGAFPDLVSRAIVPDVLLPAHSAALGIAFYTGSQFPARYRNGGFVAMHGSWNRTVASGYRVIFFPMVNGKPGPVEDFLTGFLASTGENHTQVQQWGRPVGVTVAPDGSLLVSDDGGNRIWKITETRGAAG